MKLTVTGKEFADVIACFLKDKLVNPDIILEEDIAEEFNALSEIMLRKGMKTMLVRYYLNMNPTLRVKYKKIRDIFIKDKSLNNVIIEINRDKREEKKSRSGILNKIKRVIVKIVGG